MRRAIVCGRLVVTLVTQSQGAPVVDYCFGLTREGERWGGRAIHLSPWRRNRYGDREPGTALCVGLLRKGATV